MMYCVITECANNFNLFQVITQDFLPAKFDGNLAEMILWHVLQNNEV